MSDEVFGLENFQKLTLKQKKLLAKGVSALTNTDVSVGMLPFIKMDAIVTTLYANIGQYEASIITRSFSGLCASELFRSRFYAPLQYPPRHPRVEFMYPGYGAAISSSDVD